MEKLTVMRIVLTLLLLCTTSLQADPWGKDASLAKQYSQKHSSSKNSSTDTSNCPTPVFGPFAEIMIGFHQNVISPCDGPRSHFIPSSSQYTLDAMRKYGFFKGFTMGCDRLMRENSDTWVYKETLNPAGQIMKWDPVP